MKKEIRKKRLSTREMLTGYIYVILLFLLVFGACSYGLLRGDSVRMLFSGKAMIGRKMERLKDFRHEQAANVVVVDSLYQRINQFSPAVNATYEENDIRFLLNDLALLWERNEKDPRYKVFMHVSAFYEMWLADKKELWTHQENVINFRKNLEECEIGLQKKQDVLNNRKGKK